jgi:hypothetical protein
MVVDVALNPKILFIVNGQGTVPSVLQFIERYLQIILESPRQAS